MVTIFCNLPDDVLGEIKGFIDDSWCYLTNKSQYEKFRLTNISYKDNCNNVRNIIKKNNYYLFRFYLIDYFDKWLKIKKFYYGNRVYRNYTEFLYDYTIENGSSKCKYELDEIFKVKGLSKNRHKKMRCKSILKNTEYYERF